MSKLKSIRPFIGAKDYNISRAFYHDLGFSEIIISPKMSYFQLGEFGFYLQDYYAKEWVDNSMIFLEVEDLNWHLKHFRSKNIETKYMNARITRIHYNDWGNEFFIYDPSGILWHIGEFKTS